MRVEHRRVGGLEEGAVHADSKSKSDVKDKKYGFLKRHRHNLQVGMVLILILIIVCFALLRRNGFSFDDWYFAQQNNHASNLLSDPQLNDGANTNPIATSAEKLADPSVKANASPLGLELDSTLFHEQSPCRARHYFKQAHPGKVTGVYVMGMHRSGTSVLTSLLVALGLYIGDMNDLLGGKPDNPHGFFELKKLVFASDACMAEQKTWWCSFEVTQYDPFLDRTRACDRLMVPDWSKDVSEIVMHEKKKSVECLALIGDVSKVLNGHTQDQIEMDNENENKCAWVVKDPRLALTLPMWDALLMGEKAIVFAYRHPIEVAQSIVAREKWHPAPHCKVDMARALNLWTWYNLLSLFHSIPYKFKNRLVICSYRKLKQNPYEEIIRIGEQLREGGVSFEGSTFPTAEKIKQVFDPDLDHSKVVGTPEQIEQQSKRFGCNVYQALEVDPKDRKLSLAYEQAMDVFCAMENNVFEEMDEVAFAKWKEEHLVTQVQMHVIDRVKRPK